jgi:Domain of unknown function (DUF4411)
MMAYCWDTSAWVHSWVRTSPPDIFVSLWERLDTAIADGDILSPDEVYIELERQEGDTLLAWVRERKDALIAPLTVTIQSHVGDIGAAFPLFVAGDTDRNFADPWVIALAMANDLTVVTQERRPGSPDSPTIPRVCDHFNLPYINTFEFMRREGWTF